MGQCGRLQNQVKILGLQSATSFPATTNSSNVPIGSIIREQTEQELTLQESLQQKGGK